MSRRLFFAALIVMLAASLSACDEAVEQPLSAESQGPTAATLKAAVELLTPDDVEAVTGLSGLQADGYDPATGFDGDVNLADDQGTLVLKFVTGDAQAWDAWLTDGYSVNEPVSPPVGDESFFGPSPDVSATPSIFAFRKGDVAVLIESATDANGEVLVGLEELERLAGMVADRL
jgi:hypothetical protein